MITTVSPGSVVGTITVSTDTNTTVTGVSVGVTITVTLDTPFGGPPLGSGCELTYD